MNTDLLELAKEYLRIDGDQDNKLLDLLINSAKNYMSNAGVKEKEDELYQLAIMMLVTHWYENRQQNEFGKISSAIEMGLQTIILQLKAGDLVDQSSEV
ncbi:head-tail connector protein [Virgibacillus sp. AGTR]|uniref:head-tail connector protein n=1 Tax=Virgibacillus sp. AGTR TaxID=2812055 RepID=UPI001D163C70|nr:head-tail connector protein [Virgibacillus sp. AGTR]MCC2249081.1 head-tail connector protein [Virgibacillus sp. AGTR]